MDGRRWNAAETEDLILDERERMSCGGPPSACAVAVAVAVALDCRRHSTGEGRMLGRLLASHGGGVRGKGGWLCASPLPLFPEEARLVSMLSVVGFRDRQPPLAARQGRSNLTLGPAMGGRLDDCDRLSPDMAAEFLFYGCPRLEFGTRERPTLTNKKRKACSLRELGVVAAGWSGRWGM